MASTATDVAPLLSVDELATTTGVAVRTIRFYTSKRLLPPPLMEGRTGRYDEVHVARLELIRDLQEHGYTLAAIESFLDRLPDDADVDEIAMFRALVAPWTPDLTTLTRDELRDQLGREPTPDDLAFIGADADADEVEVSLSALSLLRRLGDAALPAEMVVRSREAIESHVRSLADELQTLFRETVLRPYYAGERTAEDRRRVEQAAAEVRQLTSQSLVVGFQHAIDELIRESVRRGRDPRQD